MQTMPSFGAHSNLDEEHVDGTQTSANKPTRATIPAATWLMDAISVAAGLELNVAKLESVAWDVCVSSTTSVVPEEESVLVRVPVMMTMSELVPSELALVLKLLDVLDFVVSW